MKKTLNIEIAFEPGEDFYWIETVGHFNLNLREAYLKKNKVRWIEIEVGEGIEIAYRLNHPLYSEFSLPVDRMFRTQEEATAKLAEYQQQIAENQKAKRQKEEDKERAEYEKAKAITEKYEARQNPPDAQEGPEEG